METFRTLEDAKLFTQKLPWEKGNEDALTNIFHEKLAPYFLYGGYIRVLDRYRVYIKCVEFYFHSEKENGIKDPIVYHRNNYHVEGILPYFKPFTFHAHASGFDIAFENPIEEYRASLLIRAYEVYDEADEYKDKPFLNANNGKFNHSCDPQVNTQSTYLYDILNGFGDAGIISWIHEPSNQYLTNTCPLESPAKRKNVPLYKTIMDSEEKVEKDYYINHKEEFANQFKEEPKFFKSSDKYYANDPREWSFSRK